MLGTTLSMAHGKHEIAIDAVIVPPGRDGIAFGHDAGGRCIEVTGERAAILELYHRLHETEGQQVRRPVVIDPQAWPGIKRIEELHCPTHVLPKRDSDAVA